MLLDFHSAAGKFQQSSDTAGRAQTSVCFAASSTRASVPNPPHTSTTEQQFGIMDQNRLLQVVEVSEEFQRLVERAAQEIRSEADSVTIGLPIKKLSTSLSCKAVINEFYRSYIKV
jgi:guanyl-specific ribonuclease Sa